ncbi:ATP-binding protein [Streptomyces scabiei]|uniref:ATP-binding protein n=1 Tax=Streptomyces scabiei TaxID=1930 RepID=UPI0029B9BA3B|nr:ATP-binding protein [Streptomyces scabiei]MDX3517373.1 ATP-binding protein [Streptomyces scabiei]
MRGVPLLRTEFDAAGLPLLRSLVEEAGVRAGLGTAVRGALVQAVAEIATDTVEHGSGAGTVDIRSLDGELCCEVTEHGPGPTAPRCAGCGPRLAEALITAPGAGAGRVRVHGTARGTSTTLSVPLPASATAPTATAPPATAPPVR